MTTTQLARVRLVVGTENTCIRLGKECREILFEGLEFEFSNLHFARKPVHHPGAPAVQYSKTLSLWPFCYLCQRTWGPGMKSTKTWPLTAGHNFPPKHLTPFLLCLTDSTVPGLHWTMEQWDIARLKGATQALWPHTCPFWLLSVFLFTPSLSCSVDFTTLTVEMSLDEVIKKRCACPRPPLIAAEST